MVGNYRGRRGTALLPLALSQKLRQPRDVRRDAPRLVFREHVRLPRFYLGLAAVDVGDRLSTGVADDIAAGYRVGVPR
jgi:hypothetical protein